jgi:HEAT repeat protein
MLKHDDDIIRLKAAQRLGTAGAEAKTALKDLENATKDSDELVRREARRAIAKIEATVAGERKAAAQEKLAPLLKDLVGVHGPRVTQV